MAATDMIFTDIHVAVLGFPVSSHAGSLLTIVRRLAAAIPDAQFSMLNTAKINDSIFSKGRDKIERNIKAYEVSDGVPDGYVFTGKRQENEELFLKAAPESFRRGIEKAVAETGREVSCLMSDAFIWFAKEIAEQICVPWVSLWTAGQCSLSAHIYTDAMRKSFRFGDSEDETVRGVPGMSEVRFRDLPEGLVLGNRDSIFSLMLHQMGLELHHADAVCINSVEELDPTISNDLKLRLNNCFHIGPFFVASLVQTPDLNGCISWLDKQKAASVAYIAFGTFAVPPSHELRAVAEALETTRIPFLWSLKDDLKKHLPNGFIESTKATGLVVPWAPQLEVLSHVAVGVFVSHCGWNSLIETILCGVPMIFRPLIGEQTINGRMVQAKWKIGVEVEGRVFSKDGLTKSLDLILFHETGNKIRETARALKAVAQEAFGPNGRSAKDFESLIEFVSRPKL